MEHSDICIAGAGIIGLSLALALAEAGASVAVFDAGEPAGQASTAAAGMLAVDDPENPPELLALSRLSRALYPEALARWNEAAGTDTVAQTESTLQRLPPGNDRLLSLSSAELGELLPGLQSQAGERFALLDEISLDPRELGATLVAAAARATRLTLHTHQAITAVEETADGVTVMANGQRWVAAQFVDCTGAWSLSSLLAPGIAVRPRKGQMLTIATPRSLASHRLVLRTEHLYMVPRTTGPRRGQCVIGATVEDVGFDRAVEPDRLRALLAEAARLLPEIAAAGVIEQWAGLRPATADLLPILGPLPGRRLSFIASGHYRNGILLAPGTAAVMLDLLAGRPPRLPLAAFSPSRFPVAVPGS